MADDPKSMPIKPEALKPDAPAPAPAKPATPPAPVPAPAVPPAHDLVAAIRAAVSPGAHDQGEPPPSTEIRAGGKFRVGDRIVDAEGNPIKDEPPK